MPYGQETEESSAVEEALAAGGSMLRVTVELAETRQAFMQPTGAFEDRLPQVRVPVRVKITLPYAFLALIFAVCGAFIVSQIVLETLEERFTNQLIEVGKLSADRMVLEEDRRLATLRLLANTAGFADALAAQDAERLRELSLPVAANAREEAIEILDTHGVSVLSMRRDAQDGAEAYGYSRGDSQYADWGFVQAVLRGAVTDGRDKFAGFVQSPWGSYFYVAGPVIRDDGSRAGVVMVGVSLETLSRQFRQDTLAHTTFYAPGGQPIATTLLRESSTDLSLKPEEIRIIQSDPANSSVVRDVPIASIDYSEIVGTWIVRSGTHLGYIGAALPQSFLARTSELTRVQIFVLMAGGMLIVIGVGLYLSRQITRPLLRVVNASAKVAQGHLDVSIDARGNDEVAVLAYAFNRMMVGLREATEQRLREIELLRELKHERELVALKSRFVSMVSHEFRTPLATILSSTEFIQNYGQGAPLAKRDKHFTRIQTAVNNMTRLLEEVLVIGRTESGRMEFTPVFTNVEGFCADLAEEIQATCGDRHRINYRFDGPPVQTMLDGKLLRLALSNLLTNAIKYSPQGGDVDFVVNHIDREVVFQVKDSGIGIPEKDHARLFEAFHRASNTGSISGTGLGLYITKMAVELHNGSIMFTSQAQQGTTFVITLPIVHPYEVK